MDIEKNLAFLESLCDAADVAAAQGDLSVANGLGANPVLSHYYINVRKLKTLTADRWSQDYSPQMTAVQRLREASENADAQQEELARVGDRTATVEDKLDKMSQMLEQLVAVQTAKQQEQITAATETEAATPPADPAAEDDDESGEDKDAD